MEDVIRIPDDVWENRCQWCAHKNPAVKENRNVEKWEPMSPQQSVLKSLPCRILSVSRPNRIPGECMSFSPNHIYGICWTCKWDNLFHEPSYCLFSDQPEAHPVYAGNDYGARYFKEHYLCTCENYGPNPSLIPYMLKEAAEGRIPKNFDPETMEPVGETERNEAAEKWAEVQAERDRREEEKRREYEEKQELEEAERTGQLPGQISMADLL